MSGRRVFVVFPPLAAILASVGGYTAFAQSPSTPFEGRWSGMDDHGPVDLTVAPGGAATLRLSARPVDLDKPTYGNGKMVVKSRGGILEITVVPAGNFLKATNHLLMNNQKWDVMLAKVTD